jgi:hypothetical protein
LASKVHHPSLSHAPLDTHHFSNQHHPASVSLTARQPVSSASCFPSTDLPNQPHQATSEASEWSSGGAATLCRWISYLLHVGLLYKGETFIPLFVCFRHQPSRWEIAFLLWDKMLFMNLIRSIYFYQPYYWSTWGREALPSSMDVTVLLHFFFGRIQVTLHILILYCWTHLQVFIFSFLQFGLATCHLNGYHYWLAEFGWTFTLDLCSCILVHMH